MFNMEKNIAVIRGDGIGPEIIREALKVLDAVAKVYDHTFHYIDTRMGGCAIDHCGDPLPESELNKCLCSDSVLLGAVGGQKWNQLPADKRPEKGLLRLRAGLGVYSNNRPAKIWPQLAEASPLKSSIVEKGIDFIIVRELTGGIYFGEHKTAYVNATACAAPKAAAGSAGILTATDVLQYTEEEIERIGRIGFETAMKRSGRLCSVEKSNVLDSSRLWKKVMHRLAEEYPDVVLSDMLVDNCAMQIVRDPSQFDVIVTENMFGDILSDEASMITGSIGMIPSSSLGKGTRGLYEPIHGSAPDIAGKDIANPIGTILSAAMMLRYSFGLDREADAVEDAVSSFLDRGFRTGDIMSEGMKLVGCRTCGDLIAEAVS
jgi:3-isopropylmalate dehydrogenase